MSVRRVAAVVRSFVGVLLLGVVVPVVLVRLSRAHLGSPWPLAGLRAPWHWNRSDVDAVAQRPLGDDAVVDVVVRAGLVVGWAAIAVVAAATVLEIAHLVRHRGLPSPRRRGLTWAQPVAHSIAVGIVAVLPVSSKALASTSFTPVAVEPSELAGVAIGATVGEATVGDAGPAGRHREGTPIGDQPLHPDAAVVTSERVHVVERGDSVWSIAARLSDGSEADTLRLSERILDRNLGREMVDGATFSSPALILPGWELAIPGGAAEAHVDIDIDGADADAVDVVDVGPPADGGGENESSVVEPTDVDPSAVNDDRDGEPITGADAGDDDWFDREAAPVSTATDSVGTTTTDPVGTTTTVAPAPADGSAGGATDGDGATPAAPSPLGIEHAAMLAGGVLTLAAVRRRRRLRAAGARSRLPEPRPSIVETTRALSSLGGAERAARFSGAVRALAHHLVDTDSRPGAFLHGPDGTVEVVLTAAAVLPAPWTGSGSSWELPAATPIELISADARHVGIPCPALVAVGMVDDAELLIDLEAARVLLVDAPSPFANAVVSSIAATLATSLDGETTHLFTVDLDSDVAFGHPNVVVATGLDEAIEKARLAVGAAARSGRSSFELRTRRTGGDDWEPAVIVCGPGAAVGRSVLSVGDVPEGTAIVAHAHAESIDHVGSRSVARVVGDSSGWRLEAFDWDVAFTPFGLDDRGLEQLTELIADAEVLPEPEPEPEPLDAAHGSDDVGVDEPAPASGDDEGDGRASGVGPTGSELPMPALVELPELPAHDVVVRLLGGVAIADRDGVERTWQRSKTVELIAWLATHRRRPTRSAARTAMWAEEVRDATFSNVVSEARRGLADLVAPPDGDEWIPRTLTDELPIHDHVVTDIDLIRDRLDAVCVAPPAQAVEALRPMLAFVGGLPFADTSYLWPDADGLVTDATLAATTLCTELAEHALSLGDIHLVYEATAHGLSILPGHEDLIGLRMRAHAAAGDLAAVRQEWESYERVLNADAWSDGEPAPALVELRRELLSR